MSYSTDEQYISEDKFGGQNPRRTKNNSLESGLKAVRIVVKSVYYSIIVAGVLFLLHSWFNYPVDGKPLSTHASAIVVKTFKQLNEDGLFDRMPSVQAILGEEQNCSKRMGSQVDCHQKEDRKSLDNLLNNLESN